MSDVKDFPAWEAVEHELHEYTNCANEARDIGKFWQQESSIQTDSKLKYLCNSSIRVICVIRVQMLCRVIRGLKLQVGSTFIENGADHEVRA